MLKKIITFFIIIFIFSFWNINISFAQNSVISDDNILMKAFNERKNKLFDIINWWELNTNINNLKLEISKLDSSKELDIEVKKKILKEINSLEKQVEENKKIKIKDKKDLEIFLNEAKQSIEIKNNLIEKLNTQIEENNINKEKNSLLLEKLSKQKQIEDLKKKKQDYKKYYIFFGFTFLLLLIHFLLFFALKYNKIKKEKWVYIKFFLIFGYTIFLIWFFFYLYPELSIFLIFISGYLLAINAHLIASFVWSIIILEKYKIWNIIKFWEYKWQIIRITTINTVLLPMTEEWIFSNKPIVIPNYRLLKEEVIRDDSPEKLIHNYILKFSLDLWLDTIKLVEDIENNILTKHLHFRLNTLAWNEESFRTSMGFDRFWRVEIKFMWKWDDILNKRIERKIMWFFHRVVEEKKKILEEEEVRKEEEKIEREEKNAKDKKKHKKNNKEITNREVESLDWVNNWKK